MMRSSEIFVIRDCYLRSTCPCFASPRTAFHRETILRVASSGSLAPAMADTTNQPAAFECASISISSAVTPPPTTTGKSLASQIALICDASSVCPEPSLPPRKLPAWWWTRATGRPDVVDAAGRQLVDQLHQAFRFGRQATMASSPSNARASCGSKSVCPICTPSTLMPL